MNLHLTEESLEHKCQQIECTTKEVTKAEFKAIANMAVETHELAEHIEESESAEIIQRGQGTACRAHSAREFGTHVEHHAK
jgi:hypothetical protein